VSNTLESVTLTNNCTCSEEENTEITCYGECYEDAYQMLDSVLDNWQDANKDKATDEVRIDGELIGWQRVSGYKTLEMSNNFTKDLVESLTFNGDWTLVFKLTHEGHLSVVRYSHDEPTGAGFSLGFVPEEVSFI